MTLSEPRETRLRELLLRHENRPNYMIAAQASLSPSRLSEYAWGRRRIPPHHMIRLCEVLHCTPEDLTGDFIHEFDSDSG